MRIVSLFSGAGGLDLGLQQAGHEIIWANDIFEDAAATYARNLGAHIDTRSICKITAKDIPDCDVVVGGFPCQGFSVANWGRTLNDPRNMLYRELVRVVWHTTNPDAENEDEACNWDKFDVFRHGCYVGSDNT